MCMTVKRTEPKENEVLFFFYGSFVKESCVLCISFFMVHVEVMITDK